MSGFDPVATERARQAMYELGDSPEIREATAMLHGVLTDATLEIKEAAFDADRFPTTPLSRTELSARLGSVNTNQRICVAAEEEGEQGIKRTSLLIEAEKIEAQIGSLVNRLVELRVDIKVSQI